MRVDLCQSSHVGVMTRLFGAKLRLLRHQRKLTQAQTAELLGAASHAYIANVEAGRNMVSLEIAIRVASVFAVSLRYLLRDINPIDTVVPLGNLVLVQPDDIARVFSANLRRNREEQQLTQVMLIRAIGDVARSTISNLEAGRKVPSLPVLFALADALGVTEDELLRAPD